MRSPCTHAADPIQGWTPDFIPLNLQAGLSAGTHDEVMTVGGDEAIATAKKLAQHEGIFTGISGGAGMATALQIAASAPKGTVILTVLADTGERYLSTPLFAGIEAEMNESELEISKSTAGFHPN